VNRKIVECSSKVLAPRIVRKYALSKGSAKGPQGVRNAYCNRSGDCFGSRGASSEGSDKLIVLGGLVLRVAVRC
jgi:hypothetical protein